MLRKIFLAFLILVVLAFGGLFGLLATNSDIIIDKFHSYVENSTGAPLVSETRPVFTLLPNRGLELGASSWQKPDGSLSIRFSRASVLISSHALFMGRFSIKSFTVEDLDLSMRLEKPLKDYLKGIPEKLSHRRDLDAVMSLILHTLGIAPDAISVQRGSISLIEPGGSIVRFAPFTLNASDVHPGSETDFRLQTEMSSTNPPFHAAIDLNCAALFTNKDATITVRSTKVTPLEGFPFREDITFSGAVGYNYRDSAMTLAALEFNGPEFGISVSGDIPSLDRLYRTPKEGDFSLKLEAKGSPQRLGDILGTPLSFADKSVLSDCSVSTSLHWKKGQLLLNDIQGKADGLNFSGVLQASFAPFCIDGELQLGDLRLDAYKSEPSEDRIPSPGQSDFTQWPRVSILLSAEHLRWDRLHLEKVNARLTGQNGTYEMNPFTASLEGSPVTASLKSVMLPTSPLSARVSLNFSVPKASLDEMSLLLAGRPLLSGSGAINAALSFTSSRGVPSISGSGSLSSSSIKTSFSVLPPKTPFASLLSSSNSFDRMLLSFQAKDGVFSVDKFSLSAPRVSLSGSGRLDVPAKEIDAAGTIRIGGGTVLPVRLHGRMGDPKYSLDMRSRKKEKASIDLTLDLDLPKEAGKLFGAPR